jgi:hypothetical protein
MSKIDALRRRHYCRTCSHGYGVHSRVKTPLFIKGGVVEFAESVGEAREVCTGYPDMKGRCECREFIHG